MAQFKAIVVDRDGELELTLSAETLDAAQQEAARFGYVVSVRRQVTWQPEGRLSSRERALFLSKLAGLLAARVGMGEALKLIQGQFKGRAAVVADLLARKIEAGADFAEALESLGAKDFPCSLVALIKAGMRAGGTADALEKASDFEEELDALRQTSRKGLLSAAMGYIAAVATIVVSMLWIGPAVMDSPLLANSETDMGWALTLGNVLAALTGATGLALIVLFAIATLGKKAAPLQADRITLSVPGWRHALLGRERFLSLFSLSTMIRAGLPLERALRIAKDTIPPGRLQVQLGEAAQSVEAGTEWADKLIDLEAIDRAALGAAMDRAQISQVLSRTANQAKRQYADSVSALVTAMQLISAVSLTLGGALLFALSILPMLQASQQIL